MKTTKPRTKRKQPQRVRRLRFFFPLLTLLTFGMESRLFVVQWVGYGVYSAMSHRNRVHLLPISAPRGEIYDRRHRLMAYDQPVFHLIYTRGFAPIRRERAMQLADVLGVPSESLLRLLQGNNDGRLQVFLKKGVSDLALAFVAEHQRQLPGVKIVPGSVRVYPMQDTGCHVLGYIHAIPHERMSSYVKAGFPEDANVGWSGVEKSWDEALRGLPGRMAVEVDSQGAPIRVSTDHRMPIKGAPITLTIDSRFEREVQAILARQVRYLSLHGHAHVRHAMAVAVDPQTGDILALASYPTYDPSWMAKGMSERMYLEKFLPAEQNWASQMPIAPGSVMKPLTALFALQNGSLRTGDRENCDGSYKLPKTDGTSIHCWSHHGVISLPQALAESCDVFFYKISMRYGHWPPSSVKEIPHWLKVDRQRVLDDFKAFQREFGLGACVTDLPDAETGYVNEHSGQVTDLPYTAIGQNEVFTTLELAHYASTLANRGARVELRVVSKVGEKRLPIKRMGRAGTGLSASDWEAVMNGMHRACNDPRGTAYATFHVGKRVAYDPAGKTGTAETGIDGFDNAVFIGFAPFSHPRIAIAVAVPGGGHGADSTGPIVRAMLDHFFNFQQEKTNLALNK